MKEYKCVFFDLDHTLWDYETNSSAALIQLYNKYQLATKGAVATDEFLKRFTKINNELWDKHDRNEITRDTLRNDRFDLVFKAAGVEHRELSLQFSEEYLIESPKGKHLVPHALDLLTYLKNKGYGLYIVTNGFEEIQGTKISSGGITHFFDGIITSARAGSKKPEKEIFEFALREGGHRAEHTIMVGDNLLTDIAGARNASIDNVFYNPHAVTHSEQVTHEIRNLRELFAIL